jgi:F0F1-type ATP synthase delta subunit
MSTPIETLSQKIADRLLSTQDPDLLARVNEKLAKQVRNQTAIIYYAGQMEEKIKHSLEKGLKKKFPDVLAIEFRLSPELIAGFKLAYKDYVYEDTVQQRIGHIKGLINLRK